MTRWADIEPGSWVSVGYPKRVLRTERIDRAWLSVQCEQRDPADPTKTIDASFKARRLDVAPVMSAEDADAWWVERDQQIAYARATAPPPPERWVDDPLF